MYKDFDISNDQQKLIRQIYHVLSAKHEKLPIESEKLVVLLQQNFNEKIVEICVFTSNSNKNAKDPVNLNLTEAYEACRQQLKEQCQSISNGSFDYLFLTVDFCRQLYSIVMKNLTMDDTSIWRQCDCESFGMKNSSNYTKPECIEESMYQLVDNYNDRIREIQTNAEKTSNSEIFAQFLRLSVWFHFNFEKIHPFSDGN